MKSILKIHSIDVLKKHYKNDTLRYLDKIGVKRVEIIKNFFSNDLDDDDILWELKLNYGFEEDLKSIDEDEYERIYNSFEWLKTIKIDKIFKTKIIKEFIYNKFTPNDIINNPMYLEEINLKLETIDKIALLNGWWNKNSSERYDNYTKFIIEKICKEEGHTFITDEDIEIYIKFNEKYNNLELKLIKKQLNRLVNDGDLVKYKNIYLLKEIYDMERNIIDDINDFKENTYKKKKLNINDFEIDENGNSLTDEQVDAINGIRKNLISILNGPGGSGKTNKVIKNIYECDCNENSEMIFLAPTHAAKKNGKKAIGTDQNITYETIHSMTSSYSKYKNSKKEYDSDNEYDSDIENNEFIKTNNLEQFLNEGDIRYIVIDEMSMVNLELFYILIKTCHKFYYSDKCINRFHIVLIGDKNQLTSIGIGEPFVNLQNYIPTFRLTTNFRSNIDIQDHCRIILNKDEKYKEFWTFNNTKNTICNKYENVICLFNNDWREELERVLFQLKNDGKIPSINTGDEENTFQCITFTNSICEEVCPLIRNIFYNDEFNDNNGNIYEINDYIVMKKNFKKYFHNNDMGKIIDIVNMNTFNQYYKIRLCEPFSKIKLNRMEKILDKNNDMELYLEDDNIVYVPEFYFKPNYCRTVHSSQGLQYPIVIYILDKYSSLGNIRLNYTACSRAKDKLYLIGEKSAFNNKSDPKKRNTLLSRLDIKDHNTTKIIENIDVNYTMISNNIVINERKSIPKKVRYDLWIKNCGDSLRSNCYVCNKEITFENFHCGHIVSVKDGGNNNLNNLKPICPGCNYGMGTNNLEEYKKEYYN
jgi:exodeoxyribonuclease V alpha subunit